jgi:alpha-L-arabinofuranosidase
MTIQVNQPGTVVSSNLYGIFFEEINSAGDGGIYAELVRNRSFEDSTDAPVFWSLLTNGTATGQMALDTNQPMSALNPQALALTMAGGSGSLGAANSGYWGMPVQTGAGYNLEFYARCAPGFSGAITVSLESTNAVAVYARQSFNSLTTNWQHFTAALVSSGADPYARLVARLSQAGTVYLDFVSLFPAATFNSRSNGLRPDLARLLVDLKPSFMRFPGGSWVDGMSLSNAYHWKDTVGFLPDRIARTNIWGYMVGNGLGYHEFLQMCEDLGTQPLFDVNAGMDVHQNAVATTNLGPWIQEALDAIEYANGSTSTPYGAMRAANGHPAPFNLKHIEIGNENGGSSYHANYALFYDAIKASYPDMRIIANSWGGIPGNRPVELMDEHYYTSSSTFVSYATKYDSYSRTGPRVFVGEYAVAYTVGPGFPASLNNALGEAAFMTGLERNSDIVAMSCYAPLFINVSNQDWTPNLIYFNGTNGYGTPSYHVQKLFALNRGDYVLPSSVVTVTNGVDAGLHGAIGLGSWNTSVQYTNIVVTSNGVTLYQSDFAAQGANGWRVYNGVWSTNSGFYQQTSASITDCRSTTGGTSWANYTLSLRARKVSGSEGFLILFNWLNDTNWTWWNIGGWSNTKDGIEQMVGGSKTTLASVTQTALSTNVWYDIQIVLNGTRIQCYLNGALMQDVSCPSGIVACSSYSRAANEVVVKAVNPYSQPMATTFNLMGVSSTASTGTLVRLTSGNPSDENSLSAPNLVALVTNSLSGLGTNFTLSLPAYSVSVIRVPVLGVNNYTSLSLDAASPIAKGQSVTSTVYGQMSGAWVNLSTNANHALTYSSSDTNVAVVDLNGVVSGVGAGVASINASYGALGLAASKNVQVTNVPTTLAHRYSFSETAGTNVADSIGGAAWSGTLPRGGSFSGGQLTLASNSQQYVNLPAGILSNYSMVTIEAWAAFGPLPSACFLYGFGRASGSYGYNYIFCQPRSGRIAITATNWTGEQATSSVGDWSGQAMHIVSVFNPPAGYVALYTNGVLAAKNSAVTTRFSSVSNLVSYLGRSLYSGDSYYTVALDEFRIYSGALSAEEIAGTYALGPDATLSTAKPQLVSSVASGQLVLNWPASASGFVLESCTNLGSGAWTTVAGTNQLSGLQWTASVPMSGDARFFRLRLQ